MSINFDELNDVILKARTNIENSCLDGQSFNYFTYSGTFYISHYYLIAKWLGNLHPDFDSNKYSELLLSSQLPDGSWHQVKDANLAYGELNTTFLNYWVLKIMKVDINSEPMERARDFILVSGGSEKVNLFTKILLCLFGEASWKDVPQIPYLLFVQNKFLDYRSFGQWIGPHIVSFSYLRRLKVKKDMGEGYSVRELNKKNPIKIEKNIAPLPFYDDFMIDKILKDQSESGALGGYTHSTLFALVVLDYHSKHSKKFKAEIQNFKDLAGPYIWKMYLDPAGSPYAGSTCDGHYWDSIFCAQALVASEGNQEIIENVAKYISKVQTVEGGVPFGIGFEDAPDVDDTVEAMLLWTSLKGYSSNVELAKSWLINRQNENGGWGAFGHNNNEKLILKLPLKEVLNTTELFDYSSADCTGNILEALSYFGLTKDNSITMQKGVEFLKKNQTKSGAWLGRWSINYLFGTYVSVVGLLHAGCEANDPVVSKALNWMASKQNPDGGFGETTRSYHDEKLAGMGVSTPTQTAWALLAFLEAGMQETVVVKRAIDYLIEEFGVKNKFEDQSVIGTGHPRNVYLQYPSYAACFPVLALCQYRKLLRD